MDDINIFITVIILFIVITFFVFLGIDDEEVTSKVKTTVLEQAENSPTNHQKDINEVNLGFIQFRPLEDIPSIFNFYDFGKVSIIESIKLNTLFINALEKNNLFKDLSYLETNNFFIQLLSAHVASYFQYLFMKQMIPVNIIQNAMKEIIRGIKNGIHEIELSNKRLDHHFIELFKSHYITYVKAINEDCSIDCENNFKNFTKLFMKDLQNLSKITTQESINNIKFQQLEKVFANLPHVTFDCLEKMNIQYIPHEN